MHFRLTFATVASILAAVSAFKVPSGQPDGVYVASYDKSGQEVHTLVANITAINIDNAKRSSEHQNTRRVLQGINNIGCGNYGLSPSDSDATVSNVANSCQGGPSGGRQIAPRTVGYAVSGNVIAYFCNYSTLPNNCYLDEVNSAIRDKISGVCGRYKAGWDTINDRAAVYGYGARDVTICAP